MALYMESVADQTDHFANAFVCENIAYCYDVRQHYDGQKFTADIICLEKSSVRKGIF